MTAEMILALIRAFLGASTDGGGSAGAAFASYKFSGLIDDVPISPLVIDLGDMQTSALGDRVNIPVVYVPPPCVLRELRTNVTKNLFTGGGIVVALWKNGVPTGLTEAYAAGEVGIKVATGTAVTFNGTTDVMEMVLTINATGTTGTNILTAVVNS